MRYRDFLYKNAQAAKLYKVYAVCIPSLIPLLEELSIQLDDRALKKLPLHKQVLLKVLNFINNTNIYTNLQYINMVEDIQNAIDRSEAP